MQALSELWGARCTNRGMKWRSLPPLVSGIGTWERRRDRGADGNCSMGIFHELPAIGAAWANDCVLYDSGAREHDLIRVWYLNILCIEGQLHLLHVILGMVILQVYFLLCHTELKYTTYCSFLVYKFQLILHHCMQTFLLISVEFSL